MSFEVLAESVGTLQKRKAENSKF